MKISEELCDRIVSAASLGRYIGMGWTVTDKEGQLLPPSTPLQPGMFIGAENYYGYVVLHVNKDLSLTECEKEY